MSLSISDPAVQDFGAFLHLKNVSAGTHFQYQWTLQDLFRSLPDSIRSFEKVTAEHLRDYLASLHAKRLKPKTVSDRVTILKHFFGYLFVEGHIPADPAQRLPLPKVGQRQPKALTLEETQALLLAIEKDPELGRRDRILFELMYSGGLRAGEAVSLRAANIDFEDGCVRVVGKGNRERRVYLKPVTLRAVREYIQADQIEGFLFVGYRGKHLTVRNIEYQIQHHAEAAGISRRVSPHCLRHSIAVHYLQAGAPIHFVQNLLGHANLKTTGRYLILSDAMLKQIALETHTAIERVQAVENAESGQARESRIPYQRDDFASWDYYVTDVLEWLGRGVELAGAAN